MFVFGCNYDATENLELTGKATYGNMFYLHGGRKQGLCHKHETQRKEFGVPCLVLAEFYFATGGKCFTFLLACKLVIILQYLPATVECHKGFII